ncbi:MAG TPA: metal ABC transporter ATP-binding protein [Propionibacteriaceae bacterium]|jgi:zinc transport system ATP-binding protein|nr:metal ABC transporter ATP-binding protein [Propionibacteriaceae bacterium]
MPLSDSQTPALATDGLVVELGGSAVLHGVTASVRPGEAVALLGGNGSGKTTLVRAALGLVPFQAGQVRLFGEPPDRFRAWHRIGYVPQRSTAGLAGAKVHEVVASGRLARRLPFRPASRDDRRAVETALDAVGLASRAYVELAHLSGGQQQRVMIARALAGGPDLLLLDEPTAGVDLEHQEVLAELLSHRLAAGIALLVVLHEAGPLAPLIDRVVRLRDGRVVSADADLAVHTHDHPQPDRPGPVADTTGLSEPGLDGRHTR